MSRILAIDGGLARCGFALLGAAGEILVTLVAETEPNALPSSNRPRKPGAKRRIRKLVGGSAFDTDRRIRELAHAVRETLAVYRPDIVVAEAAGGSSGGRAASALGAANAVIVVECERAGVELVRVHVQQWRRTYVPGKRKIEDEELYDAIGREAEATIMSALAAKDPTRSFARNRALAVHAFDAVGIGRWAINFSPVARRALGIDVGGL